ncbi:hypothetical protein M3Y97_01136400 [Aphelenchoides bicaudatus]|nr:hypothetical protein M3Y97_01136400 [Aphelenchoides bicaudatus]
MSDNHCLCGIHVNKGTLLIGIVSVFLSVFNIISLFTDVKIVSSANATTSFFESTSIIYDYGWQFSSIVVLNVILESVCILAACLMIFGNITSRPTLYLPYFLYTGIKTISKAILAVGLFVVAILSLIIPKALHLTQGRLHNFIYLLSASFVVGIIALVYGYFAFNIPNKSRKCLNSEQEIISDSKAPPAYTTNTYI